jgi:hypothetical protein
MKMTVKPPQLLAINLIKDARSYVECAQLLVKQKPSAPYVPPKYFLLCQALELALKAYLAASGVRKKVLRNKIGHDLDVAFRRASRFGFAPADPRLQHLVDWLAPFHLDHFFRYRQGTGPLQLPPASEAVEIIHNTIEGIESYVRTQFMKTQTTTKTPP